MPTEAEESIDAFQHYYARPIIVMPKKKKFKEMLYDSEDGTIFGRTGSSWCMLFQDFLMLQNY